MPVDTFVVYDAVRSNVIAYAAYFPITRTLVVEELGDSHRTTIGYCLETETASIRILALEEHASVTGALQSAYQTEYVFSERQMKENRNHG